MDQIRRCHFVNEVFLLTHSEAADTYVRAAEITANAARRRRNIGYARRNIERLRGFAASSPDPHALAWVHEKAQWLEQRLKALAAGR